MSGFSGVGASAKPSGAPSAVWGFDGSAPGSIAIPVDGTYDIAPGAGLIVLHETGGVAAGIMLVGFGFVTLGPNTGAISSVADTASKINVYYNPGTGCYRIQNKTAAVANICLALLKSRNAS